LWGKWQVESRGKMPFFNIGIGVLPNTSFPHLPTIYKKNAIFIMSIKGAEAASAGRRFLRFLAGMASGCLDFFYA